MATFKFVLHTANKRKDGTYPVSLRIIKNMRSKYCSSGLYAKKEEWDEQAERFISNKKVCPMNKEYNARLMELAGRAKMIELNFDRDSIDWTLNQFEDAFLHKSKQGKFLDYVNKCVATMKDTGHIGNAKVWEKSIYNLRLFDKKLDTRTFQEIDIKYVNAYNAFMEKKGWCGNTRKHNMKTLRAVLNKAILEKEYNASSYPFGKGGFCISALEEETKKRYLSDVSLNKLMNMKSKSKVNEIARHLFLFSYFCFGMSYIDMANLKKSNIQIEGGKEYIMYKRQKTRHSKGAKFIKVPINNDLRALLVWFKENTVLIEDYLLPIISINYEGEKLYEHQRRRLAIYNKHLKNMAEELQLPEKLTSYVSRHSMAMTLQEDGTPREIISQIMGHKDLKTTNTYLDSFGSNLIEDITNKSLYKNNIAI